MREAIQTLLGTRGDGSGAALTRRSAIEIGLLDDAGVPVAGPTTGGDADLTPPPSVTGLSILGGFGNVFVEWDAPAYTQGHGHGQTNLYAAKKASSDATLPTFGDAVRVFEAPGGLTLAALPSDLSIRWHLWAKWQTVDGVESIAPAGGTNGVVATVGQIGNADLGALIIEARNLAAMDFSNLVTNPSGGAQLASGWGGADAAVVDNFDPAGLPFWGGYGLRITGRDTFFGQKFAVKTGDEFVFNIEAVPGSSPAPHGFAFGFQGFNADGVTVNSFTAAISFPAGSTGVQVGRDASYTVDGPTRFVRIWLSITQPPNGPDIWYFSKADVRRKPTKLAVNTIVAGDGAIAALAIERTLIALAAIDDARVANLSAIKLSVGTGEVGGNLRSTVYTPGSAGWQIQPNGFAEFSNIAIRGATYTGTIYAGSGTIGGVNINLHDMRTAGYVPLTSGWRLNDDGSAEFYNITARGNITANALNAATGTFAGTLSVGSSPVRSGSTMTGAGAVINADGTFAIGNSTTNISYNGTTMTFNGQIVANGNIQTSAVATDKLAPNAVTTSVSGSAARVARSTTSTNNRTTTQTIGSITTSASGAGKVAIFLSPNGLSSQSQWWVNSYLLAECSTTDNFDVLTVTFSVKRNGTTIWSLATSNAVSSGTSTRFLTAPIVLDSPGAGVACTYTLEINSDTSGGATNHAHEIVPFTYVLTESKR
ncbi:MAG TPA: hypothetical protein VNU71_13595 [Burkholderiaceae bacterium]|nr:hypothetical protein [Burkholderiaceae bacterium]